MTAADDAGPLDTLRELMPVFVPAKAAEILRRLGLSGMTECALRTRAYRRQIPFHRNGNRITFTLSDLQEIAEGQAQRPEPGQEAKRPASPPPPRKRSRSRRDAAENVPKDAWRARRSF